MDWVRVRARCVGMDRVIGCLILGTGLVVWKVRESFSMG